MSLNNPKDPRTPAQVIFLHAAESAFVSALLTIGVAIVQYISAHGLDLAGLAAVLGTAFLAQMAMVYKSLLANPNTLQALSDTEKQVQAALPPMVNVDVAKLAGEVVGQLPLPQLATLLKNELMKPVAPPVRPVPQQSYSVQEAPTRIVPVVSPPPQGGSVTALPSQVWQQLGQPAQPNADWMNQGPQPPNRAG